MNDMRACPECGQPQEWCDIPSCATFFMPAGHWTHTAEDVGGCTNLGDRNREAGAPPDTPFTRFPALFGGA